MTGPAKGFNGLKEAESDEPPPSGFAEFMLRVEDGF